MQRVSERVDLIRSDSSSLELHKLYKSGPKMKNNCKHLNIFIVYVAPYSRDASLRSTVKVKRNEAMSSNFNVMY